MPVSRRAFLRWAGMVAASAAVAACGPAYARLGGPAETPLTGPMPALTPLALAGLHRLTFGPRLPERQRVAEIGLPAWIEEQLAPEALDDGAAAWRLRRFDTLLMSADDLAGLSNQLFDNRDTTTVPNELRAATLVRQVYSRRQLYEVLVEFWTDHFNISVEKGDCFFLKTLDDRDVIRPHALGRFRDLLWASAHSPAMLTYLDNQANVRGAPNENYAREVMELHTLGVDGGYTQFDVMELARAFTGWTVKPRFWRGEFVFDPAQHDEGVKHVLGLRLAPGGQAEAEQVLEHLARHPGTAHFVAAKLAQRLLADDPPAAIIQRAAAAFLQTQGDLKAVLRVILLDGVAAPDSAWLRPKFKRPGHFVVSALRGLNAETGGGGELLDYLQRMGQPYFAWPTPDGFPDRSEPWQGNLLPRWQFSLALARNEIKGTRVGLPPSLAPPELLAHFSQRLLGTPLEPAAATALLAALRAAGARDDELPAILTAGLLSAPAFQWR